MFADPITKKERDANLDASLEKVWKVIIHNDDITPYDFVIGVLIRFLKLNAGDAEAITLTAHNSGIALVAVLPLSEAGPKSAAPRSAAPIFSRYVFRANDRILTIRLDLKTVNLVVYSARAIMVYADQ